MNKTFKWIGANWFNIVTLCFSLLAIFISYFSYEITKQALQFDEAKDSMEKTPAISETTDSVAIYFKSNNPSSELQVLQIDFPDSFSQDILSATTKPLQLSRFRIETIARNFLKNNVKSSDSTLMVGQFRLPVMINYNAIVFGQPYDLRENRFLLFSFAFSNDYEKVEFDNSFLIQRCGYPIKSQFHWKLPWADVPQEKIVKQDHLDVESLLSIQFNEALKDIKKNDSL